jgi:hypothetical protein
LKGKIIDCIFFLLLFDRLVNKTIVYWEFLKVIWNERVRSVFRILDA